METLCAMGIHDALNMRVMNKRFEMQLFCSALYAMFCWACFRIPDSVMYGEPLCFAYIYLMMQMIQLAMCKDVSPLGVIILATFACVAPTSQILQGLENSYSANADEIYTQICMAKELIFYMSIRHRRTNMKLDSNTRDNLVSALTVAWIAMDVVFFVHDFNSSYKTTRSKLCYIARFTPALSMAIVNM
jgi:hypothetical protein